MGYPVTAWRTTCLYGVSYSRASPRLFAYITSSVSGTDRTLFEVRVWRGVVYHRMAHYVLIRCFLQPSLAEALCIYTSLVSGIDRTSPTCECGVGYCVTAWRTSCLYGVSHSRKSPTFFYSFGSRTNNGLGSNRGSANTWRSASRDSSDSDASPIVIPAAVSALCISSSAISGVLLS